MKKNYSLKHFFFSLDLNKVVHHYFLSPFPRLNGLKLLLYVVLCLQWNNLKTKKELSLAYLSLNIKASFKRSKIFSVLISIVMPKIIDCANFRSTGCKQLPLSHTPRYEQTSTEMRHGKRPQPWGAEMWSSQEGSGTDNSQEAAF